MGTLTGSLMAVGADLELAGRIESMTDRISDAYGKDMPEFLIGYELRRLMSPNTPMYGLVLQIVTEHLRGLLPRPVAHEGQVGLW